MVRHTEGGQRRPVTLLAETVQLTRFARACAARP